MKKQLTAALLAATVAIAPLTATADAWQNQANSELSFLPQGSVSSVAAGEVQGEFISGWVRTQAVKAVRKALGNSVAQDLDNYLHNAGVITYSEYRDQFGWQQAAILSAIPWYLRPQIISDY